MNIDSSLDIFRLSRIGACAELDGHRLTVRLARASGPGVRVAGQSAGQVTTFWVPEAAWCAWLTPQLAIPSVDSVTDEFRSLLASYTLAPLHDLLLAQGLSGFGSAQVEAALAPATECWLITVQTDGRCLPLYLVDAPADWSRSMLGAFSPSPEETHEFALGLGWCFVPEKDWSNAREGDALVLHGMADTLDQFWLHPIDSPGRIRLLGTDCATIEDGAGAPTPPAGTLCLAVEAARARVSAQALAGWDAGREIALEASVLPVLRLTTCDGLKAFGQLVR
ncbi:MAG: hypothetical protein JHC61_06835, partial [Burkholderiaceae bacterium]|nr:hypothetical protein [Burkholderiaceae bacterium]